VILDHKIEECRYIFVGDGMKNGKSYEKMTQRMQYEEELLYMGVDTECTCVVFGCVTDTDLKDYVDGFVLQKTWC